MDNAVRDDADLATATPDEPALVAVAAPPVDPAPDSVLDHDGPWSEADYRALSASSVARGDGRAELIDGALVVGPGPTDASDTAIAHVRTALDAAMPDGLTVLGAVPVRMGIDCVLVPDLVVTRTPPDTGPDTTPDAGPDSSSDTTPDAVSDSAPDGTPEAPLDADAVLMVVEIVGPEHGALDRSFKPQVYARSRVPYLLLVDHCTPYAAASMVIGGRYHEYASTSGPDDLVLEEPFRLQLPLRPA